MAHKKAGEVMISKDSVAHVAGLAKLAFTDEELTQYTDQLGEILNMVEQLEQVDTTDVPLTTQSVQLENVMREDVPETPTPVAELMANVPTKKGTLIQVPAIIDKEED